MAAGYTRALLKLGLPQVWGPSAGSLCWGQFRRFRAENHVVSKCIFHGYISHALCQAPRHERGGVKGERRPCEY
jgi:hypothetical protein